MVKSKILASMESLDYGKGEEAQDLALTWLNSRNSSLSSFVNGNYLTESGSSIPVVNPTTGVELAKLQKADASSVRLAVQAAKEALEEWKGKSGFERAKFLLQITKCLEKNQKLLAVVEAIDTGRNIKGLEGQDLPAAIRTAYHYAGAAQLSDITLKDYEAVGIVGVILSPCCILTSICLKVLPPLSSGCTVVLKPAPCAALSSLLFAQLAYDAGLPAGVLNVIVGDGDVADSLLKDEDISALQIVGSLEQGKHAIEATAGSGKQLGVELGGKNPIIVFDSADLDAACETIWECVLHGSSFGSRILVQESIYERLAEMLKSRLLKIKVGSALDKNADFGGICCKRDIENTKRLVELARSEGAEVIQVDTPEGNFYPPTLILNVQTVSRIVQDPVFCPIVCVLPFRTAKEAISVANNTLYGHSAGIFTENSALALETAKKLQSGTIWVNGFGSVDPAAGQSGFKLSSNRNGSEDASEFLRLKKHHNTFEAVDVDVSTIGIGASDPSIGKIVQAANAAQLNWSKLSGHARAVKIYAVAEKIDAQKSQIAQELQKLTGASDDEALKEVQISLERLHYFAALANKLGGEVKETVHNALVVRLNEPLGVIGVVSPDSTSLAAFCSLVSCAIARGNLVLAVANKRVPKAVVDAFSTLPAFKVITGDSDTLARQLADAEDLQGLWYFGSYAGSKMVEIQSARTLKRTWVNYGVNLNWLSEEDVQNSGLMQKCIQFKHIWFPIGDIFAN